MKKILLPVISLLFVSIGTMAQISKLQDFENIKSAPIGTFQGINFREGGFSGLFMIPNTNGKEFWTVSDRGVNVDAKNSNTALCRPTYDKLYSFPTYAPKIHRIRIEGDSIHILQTITVKRPNGTTATGIINPTGFGSTVSEIASTDTVNDCINFPNKITAKDVWGIDSEGIAVDKDGNFWLCEEGGPTIWKLNKNGIVTKRFTPYTPTETEDIQIDTVFKFRKNNRGFEGLTITPNGKVYAIMQSPLLYPSKNIGEDSRIHRILEIEPSNNTTRVFAYLNDGVIGSSGSNQIRLQDWKLGDMTAINDSTFIVLEAAARGTSDIKNAYIINIKEATVVSSGLVYNGVSLEKLKDETGLTDNNIIPVKKTLLMDLLANEWPAMLDKAEGIAIINDSTIAIGNDNDYGQTSIGENGIATATGKSSHIITYRLSGANKLVNFRSLAGTTSTIFSSYIHPIGNGVSADAILTVGDAVGTNNYKMAGLADGLGAFDNNNGTFTLLMNHEISSALGVVRAHGAKGAFVSKWIINKNDLSVADGSDLIENVYNWNTANQVSDANPSTISFNRFCSADLPAISAYYNANSGKGTQERIFMSGEESGSNGYAMAHVVTGANAGNSYVLGKFNLTTNGSGYTAIGGWENLVANPNEQDKTIIIGINDGGTNAMANSVAVYVGNKTTSGTEADKAGLTNGVLKFVSVSNNPVEIVNKTTRATNITSGTVFTLEDSASTYFSRPEDGAWDPKDPTKFYFVTTDQIDQVADNVGIQIGRSRLWRLNFTDITNPDLGGTIDMLLDGTEGQVMFDNMTIDKYGHVLLLEDVGNAAHNGKVWQYAINGDSLKQIAKHDEARFGNIGIAATAPFSQDEETSGIIDMEDILGAGNFLLVDQAHYATTTELVEGGQLIRLFNPDTYKASLVITNVETPQVASAISVYPNPTGDMATVLIPLETSEHVILKILDLQGREVLVPMVKDFAAGTQKLLINSASLSSGSYLVEVITSTKTTRLKFVVIH